MLKNGENLKWYEDLVEDGVDPPPEYYEQPILYSDLREAYNIFVNLSAQSRPIGMGIGKIPISEIKAYVDYLGIDDIEYRELLLERIMILDEEFVKYQNEKSEKSKEKKAGKKKGKK